MNFNSPDDVFEFAEFFNGHVFVNEKGNFTFVCSTEYTCASFWFLCCSGE